MTDDEYQRRRLSFGAAAEAYERGRPGYPDQAVDFCLPAGARRVLDLGAGTGKLTRILLARGLEVVSVEPDPGMRALIPVAAKVLAGTAEEIPLPDASVDAVLVGQAFHWFDPERALPEMARVLRPGGRVGVLWNALDDRVEWVHAVCDVIGMQDRVSQAGHEAPWTGVPGLADPEGLLVEHLPPSDLERLVDNIASRSQVIVRPEAERADIIQRVRELAPPEPFGIPCVCSAWRSERT